MYRSARDPAGGGCVALLTPEAFVKKETLAAETRNLSVTLDRVIWRRATYCSPRHSSSRQAYRSAECSDGSPAKVGIS
ncbi:hypothetical protein [Paraburkholderia hospita]|uniref:hypothetical protein n=1 Tax=Paraburkholderia hospita TaxID=169430 RepID=UPI0039BE5A79